MKCLLCKREISERKIVYGGRWRDEERQLPLCRFHYGAYMAHGLKKLEKEHWLDKGVGGGKPK